MYICTRFAPHTVTLLTFVCGRNFAKIAQLVEHNLAKVGVAGSSPVFRSLEIRSIGFRKGFALRLINYLQRSGGGMVDTKDLKSFGLYRLCGFKSRSEYQFTTLTDYISWGFSIVIYLVSLELSLY